MQDTTSNIQGIKCHSLAALSKNLVPPLHVQAETTLVFNIDPSVAERCGCTTTEIRPLVECQVTTMSIFTWKRSIWYNKQSHVKDQSSFATRAWLSPQSLARGFEYTNRIWLSYQADNSLLHMWTLFRGRAGFWQGRLHVMLHFCLTFRIFNWLSMWTTSWTTYRSN